MDHADKVARETDLYYNSAFWYSMGMLDAGIYRGLNYDRCFEFSDNVAELARCFYMEYTHLLPSIMDMWQRFTEWYGLERVR